MPAHTLPHQYLFKNLFNSRTTRALTRAAKEVETLPGQQIHHVPARLCKFHTFLTRMLFFSKQRFVYVSEDGTQFRVLCLENLFCDVQQLLGEGSGIADCGLAVGRWFFACGAAAHAAEAVNRLGVLADEVRDANKYGFDQCVVRLRVARVGCLHVQGCKTTVVCYLASTSM